MTVVFRTPAESALATQGVIGLDRDVLTIEFEKDKLFGGPEIVEVSIPIDEIETVEYRAGIIGGKISIRTLYLSSTQHLPWHKALNIDFVIPRKERDRAMDLVRLIESDLQRRDLCPDRDSL